MGHYVQQSVRTLVRPLPREAALGLKPLCLPHAQNTKDSQISGTSSPEILFLLCLFDVLILHLTLKRVHVLDGEPRYDFHLCLSVFIIKICLLIAVFRLHVFVY